MGVNNNNIYNIYLFNFEVLYSNKITFTKTISHLSDICQNVKPQLTRINLIVKICLVQPFKSHLYLRRHRPHESWCGRRLQKKNH